MKENIAYPNYYELKKKEPEAFQAPRYIEYRHKWEAYPKEFIIKDFPLHLDIEVSTFCNLLCPMCPRTLIIQNGIEWKNAFMPLAVIKKIIDEGAQKGLCAVSLNGLGESLFHKQIVEIISYSKASGITDVMIHTNATTLDKTLSKGLIKAGLDKLLISLDAADKEMYEKIRVGANFDEVVRNIRDFVDIRNSLKKDLPVVRAYFIRMKENESQLGDFKRFWEDIVDIVAFADYHNPLNLDRIDRSSGVKTPKKKFICPNLWQRLFVRLDGTVVPCCRDYANDMNLGNISSMSLEDIWKGDRLQNIRRLHQQGQGYKVKGCNRCDYFNNEERR